MRHLMSVVVVLSLLVTVPAWAVDEKVQVESGDTEGFLMEKLEAGTDITLQETGTTNKKIKISKNAKLTTRGDVLTHNGTSEIRLGRGDSG